jgi:hypothetical protein
VRGLRADFASKPRAALDFVALRGQKFPVSALESLERSPALPATAVFVAEIVRSISKG